MRPDPEAKRRDLHRLLGARARGQAEAGGDAVLLLAGRDQGQRPGREHRRRPQRALPRRVRGDSRPRHRRARGDRVRAGAALDRLQGHRPRGPAVRLRPRPDPQRRRAGHRPRERRAGAGPLRGRLDQARPVGRDRDEQEGRPGHRRLDSSSRTSRPAGIPERAPSERRRPSELLAERAADHVTYVGWQAIDAAEVAAGEPHGRPRIKFCRIDEMVEASRATNPA